MTTVQDMRDATARLRDMYAHSSAYEPEQFDDATIALLDAIEGVLGEPTNVQALSLARLIRDRDPNTPFLLKRVPDDSFVMANYYAVNIDGTFECGIAPDGGVSS